MPITASYIHHHGARFDAPPVIHPRMRNTSVCEIGIREAQEGGARRRAQADQGRHRGHKGALSRLEFKPVVLRGVYITFLPSFTIGLTPRLA